MAERRAGRLLWWNTHCSLRSSQWSPSLRYRCSETSSLRATAHRPHRSLGPSTEQISAESSRRTRSSDRVLFIVTAPRTLRISATYVCDRGSSDPPTGWAPNGGESPRAPTVRNTPRSSRTPRPPATQTSEARCAAFRRMILGSCVSATGPPPRPNVEPISGGGELYLPAPTHG